MSTQYLLSTLYFVESIHPIIAGTVWKSKLFIIVVDKYIGIQKKRGEPTKTKMHYIFKNLFD